MNKPLIAFAMSVFFSCSASAQEGEKTIALVAERLFDSRTGQAITRPIIVVRGGRILSVQSGGTMPVGIDQVVELKGKTLLPGMIDMHTHIDYDPVYGGYSYLQYGDRFWSMLAVPNAHKTLMAGFTTIRNVGSDAWNDVGLMQAIDEGHVPGPRIIPAA